MRSNAKGHNKMNICVYSMLIIQSIDFAFTLFVDIYLSL